MRNVYSGKYLDYLLSSTRNEVKKVGDCYLEEVDGVFKLLGWDKPFTGRLFCSLEQLQKLYEFQSAFGKKIDVANIVVEDRRSALLHEPYMYTSTGEPFAYVDLSEFKDIDDFIQRTYKSTRNRVKRWYKDILDNYVVREIKGADRLKSLDIMMDYNVAKFGEESMYHEHRENVYKLMSMMDEDFHVIQIDTKRGTPVYVTCFMNCGNGIIVHHNSGTILDNLGRIGWLFVFDWCFKNGITMVEEMCYYAPYKETMGCKFDCSIQMTNDLDIYKTFNTPCDLLGRGDYEIWCNRRDEPMILKTNALIDKKLVDNVFRKLKSEGRELGTVMIFKDGVHVGSIPVTTEDGWETCTAIFPLKNAPKGLFLEDEEIAQVLKREIRIDTKGLGLPLSYGI